MQYIVAAANLHAFNYGLKGERDPAIYRKTIESMNIPKFTPKSGVKIQINENEPVANDTEGKLAAFLSAQVGCGVLMLLNQRTMSMPLLHHYQPPPH